MDWTTSDGVRHNSAVASQLRSALIAKEDLTVVSSGICLVDAVPSAQQSCSRLRPAIVSGCDGTPGVVRL
ncbi:hypothetical protein [Oscillatoria sp. FACHB-1407]|uniref:hypothetical protein n=1 Tax=Oscillatoria sp. FACHB-1407 TaxID=2692847 RepID=UPI002814E6CB|nr:hypothetical protein [Oscillatoria sp. FACHB-1407]